MPWPPVADVFSGFDKVFSRMTAAECVALCDSYGLLNSTPSVPSYLTAEGALTWMAYNNGAGTYYDPANPGWDPTQLDASVLGQLTLWLDAQDSSNLLTGTGTLTQAVNGDRITRWVTRNGPTFTNWLEQTNVTPNDYRPILVTSALNGKSAVRFDPGTTNQGTNSRFLETGSSTSSTGLIDTTAPFTIFMVAQLRVVDPLNYRLLRDNVGNLILQSQNGTPATDLSVRVNTSGGTGIASSTANPGPLETTNPFILVVQWKSGTAASGNGIRLSFNGDAPPAPSDSTGTNTHSGELFLPGPQSNNKLRVDLFEFFIFSGSNAFLDSTTQNKIGVYLATKYGIPWASYTLGSYRYTGNIFKSQLRANNIREILKAKFYTSIPAFIQKVVGSDQRRAAELTGDAPPSTTNATPASTKIVFWNVTNAGSLVTNKYGGVAPDNFVIPIEARFNNNSSGFDDYDIPAYVAGLSALPEGRRWLKMGDFAALWAFPQPSGPAANRYALFDREFDTAARRGVSLEAWWGEIGTSGSLWRDFWTGLLSAGGADIVDGLVLDRERRQTFHQLQTGTGFTDVALPSSYLVTINTVSGEWTTIDGHGNPVNHGFSNNDAVTLGETLPSSSPALAYGRFYYIGNVTSTTFKLYYNAGPSSLITMSSAGAPRVIRESWAHIFTDPAWNGNVLNLPKGVRGAIGPNLTLCQKIWDTYATIDTNSSEIAFLYDAWVIAYEANYVEQMVAFAKASFPDMIVTDYQNAALATGTFTSDRPPVDAHSPYGTGEPPDLMSVPLYGDAQPYNPTVSVSLEAARWNWTPSPGIQGFAGSDAAEEFAAFATQIMRLRALAVASTVDFHPWLTYEASDGSQMGTSGLWAELVLQASLAAAGVVNFYQANDNSTPNFDDAQKALVDLVAEHDAVVGFATKRMPGPPMADYNQGYLWTRCFAGGRYVWRVTPNGSATPTTVTVTEEGVNFRNSLGGLTIMRGTILAASQSDLAPLGWWVEQTIRQVAQGPIIAQRFTATDYVEF